MAYKTNALSFTLADVNQLAIDIKAKCTAVRAESAAGTVTSSRILGLYIDLQDAKARFNTAAAVPGLAAYAQAQTNDNAYDVAAAFTAMVAAISGTIQWITDNYPQSGGFLQSQAFSGTTIIDRTFTAVATAGFRTQLDSVIAAIS
jgi:hypothetical protein